MRRICTEFWAHKQVLVTGASGFIGSAVARRLSDAGAVVHGSGCSRPPPPGVTGHRAHLPKDAQALMQATQPQIVLHLAAPVSMRSGPGVRQALDSGIVGATTAMAEACRQASAHLVYISSCAVYEGGQAPFAEGSPLAPMTPYGQLKLEAEQEVLERVDRGLQATILRPFRTYGPGCSTGLVAEACRAAVSGGPLALTDGSQVREWNHVDAIVTGILAAAEHTGTGGIWNLGGGDRLSVTAIAARIFALAGQPEENLQLGALPRRSGEVDRFWGDHRRAEARWGPLASVDLDTGLRQTLAWHRARERSAR